MDDIRSKLQQNSLIKTWLTKRDKGPEILGNALAEVEMGQISMDLCNWIRQECEIPEDISAMEDYSQISAFNLAKTGSLSK